MNELLGANAIVLLALPNEKQQEADDTYRYRPKSVDSNFGMKLPKSKRAYEQQ
ncbi:MAG: hypothetical protein ABJA62_12315 [Luteimonas sp.]